MQQMGMGGTPSNRDLSVWTVACSCVHVYEPLRVDVSIYQYEPLRVDVSIYMKCRVWGAGCTAHAHLLHEHLLERCRPAPIQMVTSTRNGSYRWIPQQTTVYVDRHISTQRFIYVDT